MFNLSDVLKESFLIFQCLIYQLNHLFSEIMESNRHTVFENSYILLLRKIIPKHHQYFYIRITNEN